MRHPAMAVLALAAAFPAEAAERPWVEVRTPHFTVVSNAGEKAGQEIAGQFEHVRAVFAVVWPWAKREEGRPFYVFVARDAATLRDLVPEYWNERNVWGVLEARVAGEVADFAALRVDLGSGNPNPRENPYEMAYEAYAALALDRHFGGRMPLWFREGLVEIFGNVIVGDEEVEVGRPLQGRVFMLRGGIAAAGWGHSEDRRGRVAASRNLLPLERLVAVRIDDPEFTGNAERALYNSQAWAFTHFLMFGEGGAHRPAFNRLMDLLRAGRSADDATREALGDVARLNRAYLDYIDQPALQYQRIPAVIEFDRRKWPARSLTAAEAAALQAHFHVAMGHADQARRSLAAAKAGGAVPALAHEAEGLLLAREGDRQGAQQSFRRARELGSNSRWLLERIGEEPPVTKATAPASPDAGALIGACNGGDDDACRRLAPVLRGACDAGDLPMCMPLAWLHARGRGVDLDLVKAEELYARACDGGEPKACASLARSILGRSAEAADKARAAQLMARACAGGVTAACGTK